MLEPIKLQDSLNCNISRKKGMMKYIFDMQVNIKIFCKMILSFYVSIARLAQSIQNKKFAYLCNISRRTWAIKLLFCLQINRNVFCKLKVLLWVCKPRHAQNKFVISFQYIKGSVKDEIDFLPVDKH